MRCNRRVCWSIPLASAWVPESDGLPPIPLDALKPGLLVYDLVYNPIDTRLLQEARRRGCETLTGVKMLVYQGAAAFERWTGVWPPTGTSWETSCFCMGCSDGTASHCSNPYD